MRFPYVFCLLVTLGLVACESSPEVNTLSTTGDGSSSSVGSSSSNVAAAEGTGGPISSNVVTQPVPAERPGSSEDFVVNVGDRVLFSFNQFDLSAEARTTIENQVVWLNRFPAVTITIEGHADERGTREYNLALGERRANSVRDYMIALGVDANRVQTISYGHERPVDPNSSEDAWSSNRRGVTAIANGTP